MQKPIVSIILTMLMGFAFLSSKANPSIELNRCSIIVVDSIGIRDTIQAQLICESDTIVHVDIVGSKEMRKKRFVASVMALPFPFGFVGAHRVMLGCKPYVPIVYVATLGGCFGLLPLIDFCVLAFSKDISQYENNSHIFMWLK